MTPPKQPSLYSKAHPRKPFRPGVFDDTLDAHPPYHLYDGPVSPEDIAAGEKKAAELGLATPPPARRPDAPGTRRLAAVAHRRQRAK
jgi:hypothetical protein